MKNVKIILMAAIIFFLLNAFHNGCDSPVSDIVPYSGNWSFTFSYVNGTAFAVSEVSVQDEGDFCEKLVLSGSGTEFYIKGEVTADGVVNGAFANDCSGALSGSLNGKFTELMGAGYASGTFSDTLRNSNYKGTWKARRN